MTIESGETYFGHDTSRLRVYRVNGDEITVERPNSLRQSVMTRAEFEAWAKEPYIPIDERA